MVSPQVLLEPLLIMLVVALAVGLALPPAQSTQPPVAWAVAAHLHIRLETMVVRAPEEAVVVAQMLLQTLLIPAQMVVLALLSSHINCPQHKIILDLRLLLTGFVLLV
jgi:hypothetical protein